jgi:hypothetical protein
VEMSATVRAFCRIGGTASGRSIRMTSRCRRAIALRRPIVPAHDLSSSTLLDDTEPRQSEPREQASCVGREVA